MFHPQTNMLLTISKNEARFPSNKAQKNSSKNLLKLPFQVKIMLKRPTY